VEIPRRMLEGGRESPCGLRLVTTPWATPRDCDHARATTSQPTGAVRFTVDQPDQVMGAPAAFGTWVRHARSPRSRRTREFVFCGEAEVIAGLDDGG
jgi:hypothetical protein